jgi:ABC-type antimicrobial peptide transport system permease subunit
MRAALGARRSDIVRIVLRQGLAVTVSGLCAGVLLSTLLTPGIGSLLYGISRHDAVTYAAVPIVLLAVATVACLVPAWRAARLDPLRVLKGE